MNIKMKIKMKKMKMRAVDREVATGKKRGQMLKPYFSKKKKKVRFQSGLFGLLGP